MKKYNVEVTNQAHESLESIIQHKIHHSGDLTSAYNFHSGFYEEVNNLSTLPQRGFNMAGDNKAHVYKGHLIIYHIQEPELVLIIDIIDSRQDSIARRYY